MFQLSKDVGYVLYSALGSFYIPSCIMVFVYIRIYYAAKARARRGIRKAVSRPQGVRTEAGSGAGNGQRVTSFNTRSKDTMRSPGPGDPGSPLAHVVTVEKPVIPVVTCDFASDISTSDNVDQPETGKDTLMVRI